MKQAIGRYVSDEDVEKIDSSELDILSSIGITVENKKALDLLEDAGAIVDQATKVVKMMPVLVEKCLTQVPEEIILARRNPDRDCFLTTGKETFYTRTQTGSEM
jgi:trimethylamine:corrinoid methyltransferase-like protein